MSESRTELIAWVNELLHLNYTKVEQCGTGGAYCQIIDSIYGKLEISVEAGRLQGILTPHLSGDLPMSRVKMNAKHEYEFIANFKVLQNSFKAHKVEKVHGHFLAMWQIMPNILEANSCRKTREMQDAVRIYLNRS
jgi:RP/EB family microtubule-associated protein